MAPRLYLADHERTLERLVQFSQFREAQRKLYSILQDHETTFDKFATESYEHEMVLNFVLSQ